MKAFYDDETYASNNFFSLQFKNYTDNTESRLKAILPLILSKLSNYFIRTFAAPRLGDTFIETKIFHILKIPFPVSIIDNSILKQLCDMIIERISKIKSHKILQEIADAVIFELYFPDHMKDRNIDILQFVEKDLKKELQNKEFDQLTDDQKDKVVNQLHAIWTHPDSEVRNRIKLFAVRSPEILKPILESK